MGSGFISPATQAEYTFVYFEGGIPENWKQKIEDSHLLITINKHFSFVNVRGRNIELKEFQFPGVLEPIGSSQYTQIQQHHPTLKNLCDEIIAEVNQLVKTKHEIRKENTFVRLTYAPPSSISSEEWMTILVDNKTSRVVAYARGQFCLDEYDRLCSWGYEVKASPGTQEKDLCSHLMARTYTKVLRKVSTLNISNSFAPKILGYTCFFEAAQMAGTKMYINEQIEKSKDRIEFVPKQIRSHGDCKSPTLSDKIIITY